MGAMKRKAIEREIQAARQTKDENMQQDGEFSERFPQPVKLEECKRCRCTSFNLRWGLDNRKCTITASCRGCGSERTEKVDDVYAAVRPKRRSRRRRRRDR